MTSRLSLLLSVLLCAFPGTLQADDVPTDTLRVMCYNVENLFDCKDDSLKDDAEYLPDGMKHWTPYRYRRKLADISRVIAAAGGRRMPDIVGMCEVENNHVLDDLTRYSSLRQAGYRYLITNSPDTRGVDVALLYLPGSFRPIHSQAFSVTGGPRPTRDILHATGVVATGDTLDILVCHLPSRYGGKRQSEPFRKLAARVLKKAADSICTQRSVPHILIMGDFNDDLDKDSPIREILKIPNDLHPFPDSHIEGSYAWKGRWELIDHLLVSPSLLTGESNILFLPENAKVLRKAFLLQKDEQYGGEIPFRTYIGGRYTGGYSDHLPLVADFLLRLKTVRQ